MAGEVVGTAYVEIRPKTDGFAAETQRNITAPLQAAFGGIATGVAASKIKGFFSDAFSEATDAVKVTAQVEAAIKSTGGAANVTSKDVDRLADHLSDLAAVDDEVIAQGEAVLLTFTKVRNEAGKGNDVFDQATEAALNMSAALGTDLQGAVIQVGKALNDPIAGLTSLTRAGVQFTEQQKEQIKVLVESGDVLAAQKIILKELETQFGGAAASQATDAARLSVAFGNLKESIGTALLPLIESLAKVLQPLAEFFASNRIAATALAIVLSGTLLVGLAGWTAGAVRATIANLGLASSSEVVTVAATEQAASGLLVASSWGTVTTATTGATVAQDASTVSMGAWLPVAALVAGAVYGISTALSSSGGLAENLSVNTQAFMRLTDAQLANAAQSILSKLGIEGLTTAVKALAKESTTTARALVEGADLSRSAKERLINIIDRESAAQERASIRTREDAAAKIAAAEATDRFVTSLQRLVYENAQISSTVEFTPEGAPVLLGYASGGVVPGPIGSPHLAVVHGGEEVLTPAQRATGSSSGGDNYYVTVDRYQDPLDVAVDLARQKANAMFLAGI